MDISPSKYNDHYCRACEVRVPNRPIELDETACRGCADTDAGLVCQADLGGQCQADPAPFDLIDVLGKLYR